MKPKLPDNKLPFSSLLMILFGPFIGSFIHASANAWPNWKPILKSRSSCDHCHTKLAAIDLIPIVSFLRLGGKCRTCAAPIGWTALLAEIAAFLIALAAVFLFDGWLQIATAVLGWVLLYAALVDWRCKLLPDMANYSLIAMGMLVSYAKESREGLLLSLLGAIIGYGVFFIISKVYAKVRNRQGLGLGDAKLLAAGGAWVGPFLLSWIVLIAALVALVTLLVQNRPLRADTGLAFGPALALAIFMVWSWQAGHFLA